MAGTKEYYQWLAASAGRYEALAKSLVEHNAEKGRVVEGVVKAALRVILPTRFSLGTGFAVTASGKNITAARCHNLRRIPQCADHP